MEIKQNEPWKKCDIDVIYFINEKSENKMKGPRNKHKIGLK